MTDRHKSKPLFFRPRPGDRARLAALAERTGRAPNAILADALAAWLERAESEPAETVRP